MTQDNKFVTWGGYFYEAPSVKVLDIQSEGMLCASLDSAAYGYEDNYLEEI